jgi:hypothetical protein
MVLKAITGKILKTLELRAESFQLHREVESAVVGQRLPPCGLSKSEYYLADNLRTVILSQVEE